MTPSTSEPKRITAGDTIAWTKTLPDYPATAGWVLHYRFISAAGIFDLTATAAGADHAIAASAATTATWSPGAYTWAAYVSKAAERYTIEGGTLLVAANLAAAVAGIDTRSDAQIILSSLIDNYRQAAASHAFVQQYEIAGRKMQFNAKTDWLLEINFWKREVAREARAARAARGEDSGTKLYVRF